MKRSTPQMRDLARRLIVYETKENRAAEAKSPAGFHIYEKLRPHLATYMGNGGFRALLAHALALAKAEVPALRAVRVQTDGTLDGVDELLAQLGPDRLFECRVVLLARLLGLLVSFIGENLTLRLVREMWPKVSFNNLNLAGGGENAN